MVSTEHAGRPVAGEVPSAPAPPDGRSRVLEAWAVAGVTLLALGLGLLELGRPALSLDEAYTVDVVDGPFSDTWMRVINWDTVQAPYYLLMSVWYEVGESEFVLRLLSVAFFVASIPLVHLVGRRLFDTRTGLVAAVLLAGNALALSWAQQARSYSMSVFLVTATTYLLLWALDRPDDARRAVVYGVAAVVGIYAHFLVALVIAAHGISLLLRSPRPWRFVLVAGGTIAMATVPAAIWVLTLRTDPLSWLVRPSPRDFIAMIGDVTGGAFVPPVVLGSAALVGIAVAWRLQRQAPGSSSAWAHAVPVLWLVLPPAVLVVSTYTVKPLLHARYLIMVVPAFTLLAAVGLVWIVDRVRDRVALAVAVVVLALVAVGAGPAEHFAQNNRHAWRSATRFVLERAEPGDSVVTAPHAGIRAVRYYQRRLGGPELELLLPSVGDPPAGSRLWVVELEGEVEVDTEGWNPIRGLDEWLDEHYVHVDVREIENLSIHFYERRA